MLFSLGIKAVLLIALAFLDYAALSNPAERLEPDCTPYKEALYNCTEEMDPICASSGQTYPNTCDFCNAMIEQKFGPFKFYSYGPCPPA